jgi:hypothetical protein
LIKNCAQRLGAGTNSSIATRWLAATGQILIGDDADHRYKALASLGKGEQDSLLLDCMPRPA